MNCLNLNIPEVQSLVNDFGETLISKLLDENFEEREIPSYEEFISDKNVREALHIVPISEIGTSYPKFISEQQLINLKSKISKLNNENKTDVFILFNVKQQGQANLYSWGLRKVPGKLNILAKIERAEKANTKTSKSETNLQNLKKMVPGIQTTLFQTSKKSRYSESLEAGLEWAKKVFPSSDVKLVEGLIQDIARGSYNSVEDVISASIQFADKGTIKHEFGHKAFATLTEQERNALLDEGSKLFNIPRGESKAVTKFQKVEYQFKAVDKLLANITRAERLHNQMQDKTVFWNKMQQEFQIPKEQIELLKQQEGKTISEKLTNFLANYSYTVEVNTAKEIRIGSKDIFGESEYLAAILNQKLANGEITEEEAKEEYEKKEPTQYYSNLTVPGGTNYTENEIATPAITPSIKGHAQFSTDNGIGWFRSDDKSDWKGKKITSVEEIPVNKFTFTSPQDYGGESIVYYKKDNKWFVEGGIDNDKNGNLKPLKNEWVIDAYNTVNGINVGNPTKTRRILEVQSDLFQKGRDRKDLTGTYSEYVPGVGEMVGLEEKESDPKANQFLQLLNKDNNWVTFFVKSIIQDSAKKGYEKVLFPKGDTASKIEGHTTLEEFKKQKENRIKELQQVDNRYIQEGLDPLYTNEINQLKQELERVEREGFAALRPIYKFYENTVANILKKQGFNPVLITDEYGNTWNEIEIKPEMANETTKFQTSKLEYSGDLAIEEKIMELMEKSPDRVVAKSAIEKFFQKLKQFLRDVFNSKDKIGNFIKDVNEGRFSERKTQAASKEVKFQKIEDWNDNKGSAFEQQQRFFKRRIADLNKKLDKLPKYGKEWLELKKSINELELNVKEANKANDENLYFNLGSKILADVQTFITDLKSGERTPKDTYMMYVVDVLSVWEEFPGLETEVNRLKTEIFPFIESFNQHKVNEYATEEKEITKQEIDEQTSDIRKYFNLGSRYLGSLADSSNFLARTIGNIIKEAQNKASTKSKKTRDSIQVEIDELYKWSVNNGVKPINMYDIFIQRSGDTTKLTEPFINGKPNPNYEKIVATPELLRFYNFYKEQILEAQKDFPLQPGAYFIPNVAATSIKKTLTDLNPVKERTIKGTVTEEYLPDEIPIKFIKSIPAEEKSKDLGSSLLAFVRHTNSFKELSDIIPQVKLLQEGIKYKLVNGILTERKYKKGSDPRLSVSGKDSDLFLMTEDVIKMQVLGAMKKEEGKIHLKDSTDTDGNTKEKYFDLVGLLDNLLKYNSILRVGLSPLTSSINILLGDSQNIIEGIGGRFFNLTELRQATQIFTKQTLQKNSVLNNLLEELSPLQNLDDYQTLDKGISPHTLTKEKAEEYIYSLQKAGEKYLQSRTMLAIMIREGYLTSSGNVTEKWNNISQSEKTKLTNKIQRVNISIHGRYASQEASTLQQGIIFRIISQFRKYLPNAIEQRFAARQYDNRLGKIMEGRYITYFNLLKELALYKGQLEGGRKLSELEIYNLRKGITEIVLILATIGMYGLVGGDSDEDKKRRKNPAIKTAMTLLNRVSSDLAFFYSPESLTNLAGNAIPMLKLVNDIRVIPGLLIDGLMGEDMEYKHGSRKNKNKIVTKFEQITPGLKEIDAFSRLANKESLEELR